MPEFSSLDLSTFFRVTQNPHHFYQCEAKGLNTSFTSCLQQQALETSACSAPRSIWLLYSHVPLGISCTEVSTLPPSSADFHQSKFWRPVTWFNTSKTLGKVP